MIGILLLICSSWTKENDTKIKVKVIGSSDHTPSLKLNGEIKPLGSILERSQYLERYGEK